MSAIMPRILAIDYGTKRTGLAVTDPLQLIAAPLETIHTSALPDYLSRYLAAEDVEKIVVGHPTHTDGTPTALVQHITGLVRTLRRNHPQIEVVLQEEDFTSVRAKDILLRSGAGMKKRRDKSMLDKISASLILEDYLRQTGRF
jgi:putative Holliday junction resolvase